MKNFLALLSIITLSSGSLFGQTEITPIYKVPLISRDAGASGCCATVVRYESAGCSPQIVRKEQKSEEEILDITDPELSGLTASPNPTKGVLNVEVPANLIGYEIQVVDMTGRFVGMPIPITGTLVNLTLEGESGIYLITIRTEKEMITERILLDTH